MRSTHEELQARLAYAKGRAMHWRDAHYAAARRYTLIDRCLGVPTAVLSAFVLSFAFWSVDRASAPLWTQYVLAILAALQGVLYTTQLYLHPSANAESHRRSGAQFGSIQRVWSALEDKLLLHGTVTQEDLDRAYLVGDQAARESLEVPNAVLRQYGLPSTNVYDFAPVSEARRNDAA